jgi:predicted nucleic acid-binding protein
MIAKALGNLTYLDTNVLIYFVEGHAIFRALLEELFTAIARGRMRAVTSELSLAEVLVKPLVEKNDAVAAIYRRLLGQGSTIEVAPVSRAVLERSAEIRAVHGGRAFDAIHIASALSAGCVSILSEDARLNVPSNIRLVRLSDLSSR